MPPQPFLPSLCWSAPSSSLKDEDPPSSPLPSHPPSSRVPHPLLSCSESDWPEGALLLVCQNWAGILGHCPMGVSYYLGVRRRKDMRGFRRLCGSSLPPLSSYWLSTCECRHSCSCLVSWEHDFIWTDVIVSLKMAWASCAAARDCHWTLDFKEYSSRLLWLLELYQFPRLWEALNDSISSSCSAGDWRAGRVGFFRDPFSWFTDGCDPPPLVFTWPPVPCAFVFRGFCF